MIILILVIVSVLPALANKVTPTKVHIPIELFHLHWLCSFVASCVLYYVLNLMFLDRGTLIPSVIRGDVEVVEGTSSSNESTDGEIGQAEQGLKTGESNAVNDEGSREVGITA